MKCARCESNPVFHAPRLCKEHFIEHFEAKVKKTISDFKLLSKRDKVVVATSGGKDSLTTLFVLKKFGYDVTALLIDEGIEGYRPSTRKGSETFCRKNKIKLLVATFKKEFGLTLDEIMRKGKHPCTVCGTFRRYLLHKYSKGFDVLATGHNADDEAQAVLMNLCRANTDLFSRLGPRTTSRGKGFVPRVKPLYFCAEKEVMVYSLLNEIVVEFVECPHVALAYRAEIRDALNEYELRHAGTKESVLHHFLQVKKTLPASKSTTVACGSCGEPSASGECKACRLRAELLS
jgi:uncharacterized protein (TIGR00269 family)